jgi:hypothetical protein
MLTWKHWAWATGLGALVAVLVALQNLHLNFYYTPWKILYKTPVYAAFAWVFLLAIVCVDASVPRGRSPSLWRYISAAVVASLICIALALSTAERFSGLGPKRVISGGSSNTQTTFSPGERRTAAVFEGGFDGVVHAWFAMFIFVGLRSARRAARALADAQIGRTEAQRNLVAAQLVEAQAQVDPEFVMRTLEGIERDYEGDPAASDARLDELIAFLRDAIPRLRSEPFTPAR